MKRKIYISGILIFSIIAIFLFFPEFLLLQVFDKVDFPLGTPITWIGFISFNYLFYYLHLSSVTKPSTLASIFKECFKLLIRLSYCWGIIGFLLATNWSMTFSGSITTFRGSYHASLVYWGFNYFLLTAPILLFFTGLLLKKLHRL